MDPATIVTAITAIITSLIGGLCVAVPSLISSRKSTTVMEVQLANLSASVKKLETKLDEVSDIKAEIGKINVRLDGLEKDVDDLKK